MQKTLRIIRLPEVMTKVGLKTSKIYDMMAEGSFPRARMITGRTVGWFEHEVDEWMLSRPVMITAASKEGIRLITSTSDTLIEP